jgi:hypothetical protein
MVARLGDATPWTLTISVGRLRWLTGVFASRQQVCWSIVVSILKCCVTDAVGAAVATPPEHRPPA